MQTKKGDNTMATLWNTPHEKLIIKPYLESEPPLYPVGESETIQYQEIKATNLEEFQL